ncbi:MAG: hypothetical protein QGG40_20605, partial [Myxococcota bacterium]|nr:hypothetical protein [Myxococcota bacterium]
LCSTGCGGPSDFTEAQEQIRNAHTRWCECIAKVDSEDSPDDRVEDRNSCLSKRPDTKTRLKIQSSAKLSADESDRLFAFQNTLLAEGCGAESSSNPGTEEASSDDQAVDEQ